MSATPHTIWTLLDNRPGHRVQALGLAQALAQQSGMAYHIKELRFTKWVELPNFMLGSSLRAVTKATRGELVEPFPALAIAAGRRTYPALRWLKKQSPTTRTVQILWPGSANELDAVLLPAHDKPHPDLAVRPIVGALHSLSDHGLREAGLRWQDRYAHLPKPWIGVLIGGHTKNSRMHTAEVATILRQAAALTEGTGSLLITTSRRTPNFPFEAFIKGLGIEADLFHWEKGQPNPYQGILALANQLVVTSDSISMLSEACFTGKPVWLAGHAMQESMKHRKFAESLRDAGHACYLSEYQQGWCPHVKLDETSRIAAELLPWLSAPAKA